MKNLDLPFMGCLTERNQDMSTTMPSGEIAQEERSARRLLSAIDDQQQIAPFSEQGPQFDIDAAYRITAEIRRLREARGERVLGRKIGFTNRSIWPEYGVSAPIWGYVYDTTVHALPAPEPFDLSSFVEPRIEPEIVFGLSRAPQPDMDQRALCAASSGWRTGSRSCSPSIRAGDLQQRTPWLRAGYTVRCSLGRAALSGLPKQRDGSRACPRFESP
jgi:hypothetical protein